MGRKYKNQRRKKQNKEQSPEPEKKIKSEQPYHLFNKSERRNLFFEEFYRITLKEDFDAKNDFEAFKSICKERLPVSFRINSTAPNYQAFQAMLKDKSKIASIQLDDHKNSKRKKETTEEDQQLFDQMKFEPVSWFPEDLAWSLNVDKEKFKKSQLFDTFHKFLQRAADAGLITRQELVSMIPPLLLDVKPEDLVLDVCAAPGSKTSQMMESQGVSATGAVIANDADLKRASMLIHQVQRINSQGILVLNHNGQFLPTLEKNQERFLYDKVLADVPCTGDGAIRKLPVKWEKWHTNDGLGIHSLQVQILMRSLNLCKVGGSVLYSTCSINPIEDEAVIAEVFSRLNCEALELVDIHGQLKGLKGRKGLKSWPVLQLLPDSLTKFSKTDQVPEEPIFSEYKTYDEYLEQRHLYQKHIITQGMFPQSAEFMDKIKIENTMRVMPQDQNTGGFYIALIKKKSAIYLKKAEECFPNKEKQALANLIHVSDQTKKDPEMIQKMIEEKQKASEQRSKHQEEMIMQAVSDNSGAKNKKQLFKIIEEKDFQEIKQYFGLNDKLQRNQLIQNVDGDKKILIVSKSIARLFEFDQKNQLSMVNMGAKAFSKQKANFGSEHEKCDYRICQDGIQIMLQYIEKRKVRVNFEEFKQILQKTTVQQEDLSENLCKQLKEVGFGSTVLYMDETINGHRVQDAVCINNFTKNFNTMISKELFESYKLRYLQ